MTQAEQSGQQPPTRCGYISRNTVAFIHCKHHIEHSWLNSNSSCLKQKCVLYVDKDNKDTLDRLLM